MATDIPLIYGASGKDPSIASLVVLAKWREAALCKMHPLICFRPRGVPRRRMLRADYARRV